MSFLTHWTVGFIRGGDFLSLCTPHWWHCLMTAGPKKGGPVQVERRKDLVCSLMTCPSLLLGPCPAYCVLMFKGKLSGEWGPTTPLSCCSLVFCEVTRWDGRSPHFLPTLWSPFPGLPGRKQGEFGSCSSFRLQGLRLLGGQGEARSASASWLEHTHTPAPPRLHP